MAHYQPPSDFLQAVIADEIPFDGEFGNQNLDYLIRLTRDADRANRDWATFLLAQTDFDTVSIREALLIAASDLDFDVRSEAVLGLAQRNAPEATSLVQQMLGEQRVGTLVVEAAGYVADTKLLPLLTELEGWWDVDANLLKTAILACETGVKFEQ